MHGDQVIHEMQLFSAVKQESVNKSWPRYKFIKDHEIQNVKL